MLLSSRGAMMRFSRPLAGSLGATHFRLRIQCLGRLPGLYASVNRDPATEEIVQPFLYHKGFHALQSHRVTHRLWNDGRRALVRLIQSRASEIFAIDIHPAAQLGCGLLMDHGTGVVIGETSIVGDDVTIFQGVTLGGTGKQSGDRHPKVGAEVLLCANATVLGNIQIGRGSKIGAGSVVLENVPAWSTYVGVAARAVVRPIE
ncbi:serine O-acetyltransferase [Verminephrobacter eiseniae]|uniref:serine O-acetyltransferase n=1 Tax=Verminephrobacter eiseniae TaxID=364317 RepID=UPI0022441722|nr:serine O-acetyltransferase [Verminephrobacter eiseniae]